MLHEDQSYQNGQTTFVASTLNFVTWSLSHHLLYPSKDWFEN